MATRRAAAAGGRDEERPVAVVKKYANRRLYNTATSSYVTLDELCQMVRDGKEFVVYDAKSGDDITRSVLTQIILEEDSKGRNLLPIGFLRQVIGFYDDSLHAFLPRYLELSMENFARHQDQMRAYMEETFGRFFPMPPGFEAKPFEDIARQNVQMLQNAARMFKPPFGEPAGGSAGEAREAGASAGSADAGGGEPPAGSTPRDRQDLEAEIRQLKAQMEALQQRLAEFDRARPKDE